MRTRVILALVAALMLVISTVAIGSNMGFKIVIPLGAGITKYVSLPYYCSLDGVAIEGGTATAANLRNDIMAAGGSSVSVYSWGGTTWQRYSGGGFGQVNFGLQPGNAYQVITASGINWVVVGSHNPSLTLQVQAGVTKYVSLPYHTTETTAATLRNEMIAAGGSSVSVYRWDGATWQRYSGGGFGQVNFGLTPGEGYQVISASAENWTPMHY